VSDAVDELVRRRRLEHVLPDRPLSREELEAAQDNLESAERLAASNARLAYKALYDAARTAISAHMRAHGYRVRGVREAHVKTAEYATAALGHLSIAAELNRFGRMRIKRHNIEYGAQRVGEAEVRAALRHAHAIVEAIAQDLAG
jgi:hypothetical protein